MTASALQAGRQDLPLPSLSDLVLAVVIGYAILNAIGSDRVWILHRFAFAFSLAALAILFVAALALRRRAPARTAFWLTAYAAVLLLIALPVGRQEHIYPLWVAGDFAVLAAPALFLGLASAQPALFDERSLQRVLLALLLVALAAPLFRNVEEMGRFRPPEPAVLAGVCVWFFTTRGPRRALVWLGILAVFGLAWASTVRYAPVALVGLGLVAAAVFRRPARIAEAAGLAVVLSGLLVVLRPQIVTDLVLASRFADLFAANLFAAGPLYERLLESRDIIQHFREHASPLEMLLGFGYGATYRPQAFFAIGDLYEAEFWITAEGLRHITHFGPLRFLLRYGLVGLALVAVIAGMLGRDLLRLGRWRGPARDRALLAWLTLTMLAYFMRFFLQSVENDLLFAFFLAAYIGVRYRSKPPPVQVMDKPSAATAT